MKTKNPTSDCILFWLFWLFSSCAKSGRIVNVGSVNGICAYPGLSVYCATKFAIEGFSDVLRHEMRKLGVKVILIRPGGEKPANCPPERPSYSVCLSSDFARLTGIMSRQESHASEMWDQMPDGERMLYNTYFQVRE